MTHSVDYVSLQLTFVVEKTKCNRCLFSSLSKLNIYCLKKCPGIGMRCRQNATDVLIFGEKDGWDYVIYLRVLCLGQRTMSPFRRYGDSCKLTQFVEVVLQRWQIMFTQIMQEKMGFGESLEFFCSLWKKIHDHVWYKELCYLPFVM